MNWPAALPGAALRVTRTAVGRRVRQRVLQVALLVGGLFVLGVVFGGHAQAAEGVPGKPVSLGKPGIPVVDSVVKPVQLPGLAPVLAPVTDTVERVVQPVSDVVTKTVTEVLAKVQVPPLSSLPTLPSLPAEPTLPVRTLPAQSTPVPVSATPQPSHGGGSRVGVATTAHRHASEPAAVSTHVAMSATYGPNVGAVGHAAAVRHAPSPSPSAGRTPTQRQAPAGDPDGAQRNQPGVDNGTSRHCDACAVTLGFRVPVRIVPGVVVCADAAETRDRYRDVPVFPG